jgi:hypothetical protein
MPLRRAGFGFALLAALTVGAIFGRRSETGLEQQAQGSVAAGDVIGDGPSRRDATATAQGARGGKNRTPGRRGGTHRTSPSGEQLSRSRGAEAGSAAPPPRRRREEAQASADMLVPPGVDRDRSGPAEAPAEDASDVADLPPGTGLFREVWKLVDQPIAAFPDPLPGPPVLRGVDPLIRYPDRRSFRLPFEARNIAVRWKGFLRIDEAGGYVFTIASDDGSALSLDGALVIDNEGLHRHRARSADLWLEPGLHAITMRFFQNEQNASCTLDWVTPAGQAGPVPTEVLYPPASAVAEALPVITAIEPPLARGGEEIRIHGSGFPLSGAPVEASFEDAPLEGVVAVGEGVIVGRLPFGVDRGDIAVRTPDGVSLGFPYEAGDAFGLLGSYAHVDAQVLALADLPPPTSGDLHRIDERLAFGDADWRLPFPPRQFGVRHTGTLWVRTAGLHRFRLGSDDGSMLWLDDLPVIENDGTHRHRWVEGGLDLGAGGHAIALAYFNDGGPGSLVLEWMPPGASGWEVVPRGALYAPAEAAYTDPPHLDAIAPAVAHAGDTLRLTGAGFFGDGSDLVLFEGVTATPELSSPSILEVQVPDAARSGEVRVQSGARVSNGVDLEVLGRGLRAAYYTFEDPLARIPDLAREVPALERLEPAVRFGERYSFGLPFEARRFAARMTGLIDAPRGGAYGFRVVSDDGVRVRVGGDIAVEDDSLHQPRRREGQLELSAGRHPIVVEFFNNEGHAVLELSWRPPGGHWHIIPETALFPE